MRNLPAVFIFSATTLCYCISLGFSFEYGDELRPRLLSRRAIDGTRGRKHFNPKEDNFFDDYGFEKGQYHGEKEKSGYEDLKSNVPGEPGVDYPAFVKIPRTTFSCIGRDRGYYADEEAGCQVFHVCDDGLVSTFICPIGSLFSQRLLTCDWWSKVSCSKSREFYSLQKHDQDVSLTDNPMLRHTLSGRKETVGLKGREKEPKIKDVPVVISVKKNENELKHNHKQKFRGQHARGQVHSKNPYHGQPKDDSPVIRITSISEEDRRFRGRGYSRLNTINTPSETTTVINNVNEAVSSPGKASEGDRFNATLTTLQTEYKTSEYVPTDVSVTKIGLDENVTEPTNPAYSGDHNSAAEYDDMEGKESIGLVNSHSERNLDEEERNTMITVKAESDTISSESVDSTTPVTAETIQLTTPMDETIQAKESISLVHSKIQEKTQLFGREKANTNDNSQNINEAKTEQSVNSVDDIIGTTLLYQTEVSTELPKSTETLREATTSFIKVDNTQAIPTKRTQQVRKMSGFRINVAEKRTMETTTLPYDEISSSDYQELLNSSEVSFTSTMIPITVTTEDFTTVSSENPTTIMPNNVRRISDAHEESNAPFGVMLSLNGSSEFPVNNDQSPIGINLLSQLISQHVSQPIDLTNLEIIKSNDPNQQLPQNQDQANIPMPAVRTYQHFRINPTQQNNQENYRNYQQQPITATTFKNNHERFTQPTTQMPQQNYDDYQSNQENQNNYRNFNNEVSRNQQFILTTTETVPKENYQNYQNQQVQTTDYSNLQTFTNEPYTPSTTVTPQPTTGKYRSRINENNKSRNSFVGRNSRGNIRHSKLQSYSSVNVRNHFPDPIEPVPVEPVPVDNQREEPTNYNSYQSQTQEPVANNNYQIQPEEPPRYNQDIPLQIKPEEPSNINSFHNQPEVSLPINSYTSQPLDTGKFDNSQNPPQLDTNLNTQQSQQVAIENQQAQPENTQNYVNFQTHHHPEQAADYQQNYDQQSQTTFGTTQDQQRPQSNFVNSQTVSYHIQTTQTPQLHHRPEQNIDKSQNYVTQKNTKPLPRIKNKQPIEDDHNYDYSNYDNVEDIIENTNFGEFGVRISAKNPNTNFLKVNTKKTKLSDISSTSNDAYSINAGLQGKTSNFLWTMNQLAKTDRLPRPFTQNKNNADDSSFRQRNSHHRNFINNKSRQNVNSFRPVPMPVNHFNSNYNRNQQYTVNVDEFAAPRFENAQSTNQQVGKINESREERILNSALPIPSNPFPLPIVLKSQAPFDSYSTIPNIPEVNTVPFDKNSQFVQVPAPDLSQYKGSIDSNNQAIMDPPPPPVDYSDYQLNTQLPEIRTESEPQPIGINYQPTTQSIMQDVRVPQRNVEILQDSQEEFRPTVVSNIDMNEMQSYSNMNSTQQATKTTVETEFIPSLSFDFGSVQGRNEYLEALEKGLVPNDSNASVDENASASESVTMAIDMMEEKLVQETTTSDIMDNFKDIETAMSGMER